MELFLAAFTVFDLCLSAMAAGLAVRLARPEGKARWASQRLWALTLAMAWLLAFAGLAAIAAAWSLQASDSFWAGIVIAAPTLLLLLMGAVFAAVDVMEDGVLGNGLKRER